MNTSAGKIFALGQTGNKLFQLAYAFTSNNCKELDVSFSGDFANAVELSQLETLSHKLDVKIISNQSTRYVHKLIHNLCIRFGSKSRSRIFNSITRRVLQVCYLKFAKDNDLYPQLVIANGSGDIPTVQAYGNYAVLGYIQNANILRATGVKEAFGRAIDETLGSESDDGQNCYSDHTVLLQIRLGDYLKDKKIGVCNPDYYSSALNSIDVEIGIEQIHLYSNQPELAISYIPLEFRGMIKIVGDDADTPLEVINQMRNYCVYVISNSTFGWWGAYLSRHGNPIVYAPAPWFRQLEEPIGLIPENWKRIQSSIN